MAIVTRLSEQEYRDLVLNEDDHPWELWDGVLVEKPPMSMLHDDVASYLGYLLPSQLDRGIYRVNVNGGKTRFTARNHYIPDVVVIPAALVLPFRKNPRSFNAFAEPLPLVVEIWSRTTGEYMAAKIPMDRERGDLEIWFIPTSGLSPPGAVGRMETTPKRLNRAASCRSSLSPVSPSTSTPFSTAEDGSGVGSRMRDGDSPRHALTPTLATFAQPIPGR